MDNNQRVRNAIENAKDYTLDCIEQRSFFSEKCAGSFYELAPQDILSRLKTAEWKEFKHKDIAPDCTAFITKDLPYGILGIVSLDYIPDNVELVLDDRKNTGNLSLIVRLKEYQRVTSYITVLIVGIHEGTEQLFTFHPGYPIKSSELKVSENYKSGQVVTKREAEELGFINAKVAFIKE